jgi:hypothetical protein
MLEDKLLRTRADGATFDDSKETDPPKIDLNLAPADLQG